MSASPQVRYDEITAELQTIAPINTGKMFGMPCLKNENGKAFVGFFHDEMVFKLANPEHSKAMALSGARLFDPSGQGRPMKEWVLVPAAHHGWWLELAQAAFRYSSTGK